MRIFSKVLAVVLCVCMLFTTAFASGLKVSFVDFRTSGDSIIARVDLRNDASADALSGKVIIASYDEDGNLVAIGESDKVEVAKGAEKIVSASVASGANSYKAFVWNDAFAPNGKHAVSGASSSKQFVADTGVNDGYVSASNVATTGMSAAKPERKLYSPFKGRTEDDASEATGGRCAPSDYPANDKQYHEMYYVDPALEGYDFFVFAPGNYDYSAQGSPLLTFDIVKDAEIIILSSSDEQEFEGFELTKAEDGAANGKTFAEGRYMNREFGAALRAIGIRPTYAIAKAYKADKQACYEEYIKPAYDAASDDAKAGYDENITKMDNVICMTNPDPYIAMYTKTFTLGGADSAQVVIPAESTGKSSRNFVVLVKPVYDANAKPEGFKPLAKAGNISAVPALKGVEIDGAFVSIDKFTDNAYSYLLSPLSDCVLPVIKGVTSDNALYVTTDYDIASDAKSAVATITVKNLYAGTSAVYTVNISINEDSIPEDAHDIVNLNGTTLVDNTLALKNKTVVEGVDASDCPIDTPVSMVSGKTYAQYIAYINEYYGYEEGDEGYITGTGSVAGSEVVATNSNFAFANNFAIGNQMGVEGNRRQISYVSPMYAFYKGLYRHYSTIALNQLSNSNHQGWFTGALYTGCDKTSTGGYYTNAKTDKLPSVPWFTAVMKEKGTVYVNSYSALPILEAKGYQLMPTTVEAYYGIDTNNNSKVAGPTKVYYKVFEKGEIVEIFNPANNSTAGHPPAWFFTTGTPDEVTLEYGKKSSGVAATSYNSTLTNGVLYKGLFADVTDSSATSGNQWVSDYQPLNQGQRIKSIEDPSLVGCDYFAFNINGGRDYASATGNILEFKVDKDCEVLILTKSQDSAAVFGDFTKNTSHATVTGMFPQNNYYMMVKALGIPDYDVSIDMINDFYKQSGYTFTQIYDKWLSDYFPGATVEELLNAVNVAAATSKSLADGIAEEGKETLFDSVDSVSNVAGSDNSHAYTVSHTKRFKAGDTVAIPAPTGRTGAFDRPVMVVIKPSLTTTITDHVTDFKTVATGGSGYFILGPGANASVGASYSDRLTHDYITTNGYATPSDASLFSVNSQRCFGVTDEILGLENCYYLRMLNQTMPASWVGGNSAEDLAWMTFKVNQDCEVIVVPGSSTPNFVTVAANGWTKSTLDDKAFTLTRHDGGKSYSDLSINATKTMYTKSFKAGDTVTLYNSNNGSSHSDYNKLPYFAFVRVK